MEEEVAPADALSLMFNYFDRKFEGMQNSQKTEPPPTKKSEGHEIQGKGNKQQFNFNSEISFEVNKCLFYLDKGDFDSVNNGLNLMSSKIKKRNKLIKLADRSSVDWSIVEEYEADPIASDSDDSRKIRQAEQRAIRKKKKTPTSQQQSGSSTLTKPNGYQFRNASFNYGYSPPMPTYNQGYQGTKGFMQQNINPFRFVRTPRSTDTCMGCREQGHWRKYCPKLNQQPKNGEN